MTGGTAMNNESSVEQLISQSVTPNKRAQTETTLVLSVNSSFSSNSASNLASLPTDKHNLDNSKVNIDFFNN